MSKVGVFTIGADPEIALIDTKTGVLKSAIGLIKGTKYEPEWFDNGGNIQRDNVAAEFGIKPTDSPAGFLDAVRSTMALVMGYLPKDIQFVRCAAVDYPETELDNEEARQFGCDPDYNAWNFGAPFVSDHDDKRADGVLRSFGGHIHVGYVDGSGNDFLIDYFGKMATIQVMDCLLGIYSVINDNTTGAQRRRELYGKAGAFRPTDYGVEYRVLSNFWIFDDDLVHKMWELTETALKILRLNRYDELVQKVVSPEEVQLAINTGNKELAENLWDRISTFIKEL